MVVCQNAQLCFCKIQMKNYASGNETDLDSMSNPYQKIAKNIGKIWHTKKSF